MDSCLVLTESLSRQITSAIDLTPSKRVSTSTSSFLAHCLTYSSHASMMILKFLCLENETGSLYCKIMHHDQTKRGGNKSNYIQINERKREVPRDVRNSKVRKQDKVRRDWSRHKNTCKSQSGTGPGVRRSKRPLLECRTRCKCSMETLHK